jgi:polysaccharide export outer membrane protein
MIAKFCIGFALILILSGCGPNLPPLPPPDMSAAFPPEAPASDSEPENEVYTLGPEDVLQITVYEHDDLSREVAIAPDGAFAFPLIGKVEAAGLTTAQVEQSMKTELGRDFLVDPQISVVVTKHRNRHVYVLGAVRTPGVYELKHNATLLEVISEAGGVTEEAGWMARLVRASNANSNNAAGAPPSLEQVSKRPGIQVDLERLFAGEFRQPIQIHNGDTIHVPKSGFVFVTGEVVNPGRYPLGRGLTVDRAIILAGGFTKFAAKKSIRVRRLLDGQPQEFRAQMHNQLQGDDVIHVPESVL